MHTEKETYLLGVDIGTNSSKGVMVESNSGEIAGYHVIDHAVDSPKPGWAEHDAEKVWWGEFVDICQELLKKTKITPSQIKGVGTSGLGACVLPLDKSGNPLRKAILYGIDIRAIDEMEELEKVFGRERIFQISLMNLSTQSTGPKILWIKNHEPEIFQQADYFLTSEAYLVYRLTGKYTLDYLTAADYAPMFNVRQNRWDPATKEYIAPSKDLGELYWSTGIAGSVTSQAARQTGLLEGTPVIVGTTDGGSEALSVGVAEVGDMMLMFGSSFYFILKTDKLTPTQLIWSSAWLEQGAFTLQGGTSTAGSITRWFRDNLAPLEWMEQKQGGQNAYTALAKLLDQSPLGANGVIALPYFEGERTPVHDPKAKGVLFGLSMSSTRADIYRALLEGVGYGIRHIVDEMHQLGIHPRRLLAVGGGTQNPSWLKIVSNIADIEMIVPEKQNGACYGDAFMAAVGIGIFKNLGGIIHWVKPKEVIQPDSTAHLQYEKFYKIFRSLYPQTKDLMHDLSNLTRRSNGIEIL
jgi:xylulokinase